MIMTRSTGLQFQRGVFEGEYGLFGGGECARGGRNRSVESAAQRAACAQFLGGVIPVLELVRSGHTLRQKEQDEYGCAKQSRVVGTGYFHAP